MRQINLNATSQLQFLNNRLNKHAYLSKEDLPNCLDAKTLLLLQKINSVPNRQQFPYLYHWFVIMKQFAQHNLKKWIENDQFLEQDVIFQKNFDMLTKKLTIGGKEDTYSQCFKPNEQIQSIGDISQLRKYVMIVRIKADSNIPNYKNKTQLFRENYVKITKFQPLEDGLKKQIFIQFSATHQQCNQFKNQVTYWSQVYGIQVRKGKKVALRQYTL